MHNTQIETLTLFIGACGNILGKIESAHDNNSVVCGLLILPL